jgi:hypothetical protein
MNFDNDICLSSLQIWIVLSSLIISTLGSIVTITFAVQRIIKGRR